MKNLSQHSNAIIKIRNLVNETLKSGSNVDRKIDGSNTLLHLSVEHGLLDCTIKLLSSGANSQILNSRSFTANDIALTNGNQMILQVLQRREVYGNHLQLACGNITYQSEVENFTNVASYGTKIQPLRLGVIYEDYLDWTDSKRCLHLKELLASLKLDSHVLNDELVSLYSRKTKTYNNLKHIHDKLRSKEHNHCLHVWEMILSERNCRSNLATISEEVARLKKLVEQNSKRVLWRGGVLVKSTKSSGLFSSRDKSWESMDLELTGDSMLLLACVTTTPLNEDYVDRSFASTPLSFLSFSTEPIRRQFQHNNSTSSTTVLSSSNCEVSLESVKHINVRTSQNGTEMDFVISVASCDTYGTAVAHTPGSEKHSCSPSLSSRNKCETITICVPSDYAEESSGTCELELALRSVGCEVRSHSKASNDLFLSDEDVSGCEEEGRCILGSQSLSSHFESELMGSDLLLSVSIPHSRRSMSSRSDRCSIGERSLLAPPPRDSLSATSGLTSVDSLLTSGRNSVLERGDLLSSAGSSYSTRPSMTSISDGPLLVTSSSQLEPSLRKKTTTPTSRVSISVEGELSLRFDTTPISISRTEGAAAPKYGSDKSGHWKHNSYSEYKSERPKQRQSVDDLNSTTPTSSKPSARRVSPFTQRTTMSSNSSSMTAGHLTCLRSVCSEQSKRYKSVDINGAQKYSVNDSDLRALRRLLSEARGQRDALQKRLESVITTRERMLEKLHYLQALRNVVDNPPQAPTRTLSSTKTLPIEKAMAMMSVYRSHVDNVIDSMPLDSSTCSSDSDLSAVQFSEAENFVRIMLQSNDDDTTSLKCVSSRDSEESYNIENLTGIGTADQVSLLGQTPNIELSDGKREQVLLYGPNSRMGTCSMSVVYDNEGSISTSASVTPSTRRSDSASSPYVDALFEAVHSPFTMTSIHDSSKSNRLSSVGNVLTAEQLSSLLPSRQSPAIAYDRNGTDCSWSSSSLSTSARVKAVDNSDGRHNLVGVRMSPWKLSHKEALGSSSSNDRTTAQDNNALNLFSSPVRSQEPPRQQQLSPNQHDDVGPSRILSGQVLGAPPSEFQSDFDEVMRQLEELWNCELESFETVGQLAQCLVHREHTWQRLSSLKLQEHTMVAPEQGDLYDIEL